MAEAEAFMGGVTYRHTTHREKKAENPELEKNLQAVLKKLKAMSFGDMMSITRSYLGFNFDVLPAARLTSSDPSLGSSLTSSTASSLGSRPVAGLEPAVSFARKNDPPSNFAPAMKDEDDDPFDDSEDGDDHEYNIPIPDYGDDDIFGDDW